MDLTVTQCTSLSVVIVCKAITCLVILAFLLTLFKSNNPGDQITGTQFARFVHYPKRSANVIKITTCLAGGCVLSMKNAVKGLGFGIFTMVEKSHIIAAFGLWSSGYHICDEST